MLQPLRGFRDFYPETMAARRKMFDRMIGAVRKFGFREIDTPSVEGLELFKLKSGPDIVEETFSFVDKGGREVTLIPELTPSVARMISARRKVLTFPQKWYSLGKMWRYEEPQSGRLREFYQLNVDIFGADNIESDAEIIAVGIEIMKALGIENEIMIKISHRQLMQGILECMGVQNVEEAMHIIDRKDKIGAEEFKRQILAVGIREELLDKLMELLSFRKEFTKEAIAEIKGAVENMLPFSSKRRDVQEMTPGFSAALHAAEKLEKLSSYLKLYEVENYCALDLGLVRGLSYYTGIVFECFDKQGAFRAIFGGGRYDNLIELFGDMKIPAVGFAIGDAVVEQVLRKSGKWYPEKLETDFFVAFTNQDFYPLAVRIAKMLRNQGFSVEIDLLKRNLEKQFKYADRVGARRVIIIGDEELKEGKVRIKNMETGEQETMDLKNLLPEG
ncbi:MAG: histidine--tRNA ligase [Thermoplasmata archaeon]|nr:histidine--tRNA ligase [Thermoplasmata archaeon]